MGDCYRSGKINEISSGVKWVIENFFPLCKYDRHFTSPEFPFAGDSWRLEMRSDFRRSNENESQSIDLQLCRATSAPPTIVEYCFILITGDGAKYGKEGRQQVYESERWGQKISFRLNSQSVSELMSDETLTVVCYLKHFKPTVATYSIVLVGGNAVGKSVLLSRFVADKYEEYNNSTVGAGFETKFLEIEGETIKVNFWDTAGQERFRPIIRRYYTKASGFVVVYDVTDPESLYDEAETWLQEIDRYAPENVNKLLIGNKYDYGESCRGVKETVGYQTAKKFADEHGMLFFPTSAKTGMNVELAFMTLIREIKKRMNPPTSAVAGLTPEETVNADSLTNVLEEYDFVQDFNEFLKEKKGVDVTFVLETPDGKKEFFAHRLVLGMWSSYFADDFCGEQRNKEKLIISLKNIDPKPFKDMIRFCYGSKPCLRITEDACALLEVAFQFKVTSLFNLCRESLRDAEIEPKNAFSLLVVSEKTEDRSLRDRCNKLLQEKTKDVMESYELRDITPSMVHIILDLPKLSLCSEYELIKWIFEWAKAKSQEEDSNAKSARECLENFLKYLNFLALTLEEFAMLCKDNPGFFSPVEFQSVSMNIACPGTMDMPAWYDKDVRCRAYTLD